MPIYNNILEAIGRTPIIRLNSIPGEPRNSIFSIFIKNESLNPGGSHKARIAYNMILDAEKHGFLSPFSGQTILEYSGGNTGIGIAMAGAVRGYRVVLVIPDNYSLQKQKLLKAYGAEVILSDSSKGNNSHGELAIQLQFENPEYVMLNQGSNPANPQAHILSTCPEIQADFTDKSIDYLVAGIGTGGHISAVGSTLRNDHPNMRIIGVQPEGCDLLQNIFISHKIQGLSVGLIPPVLSPYLKIIDSMVSVTYEESLEMMRLLLRNEGMSVGLSSGANLAACMKIVTAHQVVDGERPVNILTFAYDSAYDYLANLDDAM
jgi:cysteine synthase A